MTSHTPDVSALKASLEHAFERRAELSADEIAATVRPAGLPAIKLPEAMEAAVR